MKQYLNENMGQLVKFCKAEGLSLSKVINCPNCYNHDVMEIQYKDKRDPNSSPRILLTIRRGAKGLIFEPSEDIKEYLGK